MRKFTLKVFNDIFEAVGEPINFIDVGARGDIERPWKYVEPFLRISGFEPDSIAFEKLQQKYPDREYYSCGLGSANKTLRLYRTFNPSQSSIYPLNEEIKIYLEKFWAYRETVEFIKVSVRKLDDIYKNNKADVIKIDTQGSEFDILKGSARILTNDKPMIFLETWTREIYKGQPLFSEIVKFLYDLGFELIDLSTAASWNIRLKESPRNKNIQGDLVGLNLFFAPKIKLILQSEEIKIRKYAAIFSLFGFYNHALYLLESMCDNTMTSAVEAAFLSERTIFSRIQRLVGRSIIRQLT